MASTAKFITLTYSPEHLPISENGKPQLNKRDVQLFKKRLRKENQRLRPGDKVRYYTVGEYGSVTARPHYHSILFNMSLDLIPRLPDIWGLGQCHVGNVSMESIHYVTKYVINKPGDYDGREVPFALMSKRPGIGSNYLQTHTRWHRSAMRTFVNVNGIPGRMPRYYREKIFSPLERSILAVQSISDADLKYFETIERLKKFHSDPDQYYEECIANQHELIKSKSLSLDKL